MKRGMIILVCVMMAGAMAFAATNVVSVNIVGYSKTTAPGIKYAMVAQPFYPMGDNTIQSVISSNQLSGGANVSTADNVIFFSNSGQTYLTTSWLRSSDGTWRQGFGASTQAVDAGRCFWIKSVTNVDQEVTFMGEIVMDGVVTQTLYQGFNMVSYPYNTDQPVTNTGLHTAAVAGPNAGTADQIIKYDVGTQTYNLYYKKSTDNKWYKGFSQITPDLKMGEAFWFLRRSVGTVDWVESVPYSL